MTLRDGLSGELGPSEGEAAWYKIKLGEKKKIKLEQNILEGMCKPTGEEGQG